MLSEEDARVGLDFCTNLPICDFVGGMMDLSGNESFHCVRTMALKRERL